jgi:hypothetical protein
MQLKMVRLADLVQAKLACIMCGIGELPSCTLISRLRRKILLSHIISYNYAWLTNAQF